ncbi:3-oxoacyl-ACP synthase [Mycobacterium sp. SMC-2]|uniref:3-oxoacyl-[acyl-carrier-protein] synthase III C-terminal domain-containing protein n=1 Tax=Mycobacterium sp. SMC-2 TaxID=2857058 RepID=UPI0021B4BEBA|nr:3-oxoacyl-[acyl-carrier-protein] synthase III C-terminal domain-containing protein [Mycobacterium sp. SMC-2]UXA08371.1 3-oxoacyl-ACP synthase [Mycobacterium sp. SMC-2]
MGTVIDQVDVAAPRWRHRHSALHLAVNAAKSCLQRAGCDAADLDLIVNAGIYRDRNMGEPALAALIQDDIGANPEDPHPGGHGTFSFDVANGTCGVLTALQIVDGFLRARSIRRALILASDADPGHGLSEHFPFSASGAAVLCGWSDDDYGLGRVSWVNTDGADAEALTATVGFADSRNVLRFTESADLDDRLAAAAADAARACVDAHGLVPSDVDMVIAAPARAGFSSALGDRLKVPAAQIIVADDERMHTAALAAAFGGQVGRLRPGARALLVAAGAGVTAGAALYCQPPGKEERPWSN